MSNRVFYMLRPIRENLKDGGPGWYNLRWRPIFRETFSAYVTPFRSARLFLGLKAYRCDRSNGWNGYYKHFFVEVGFLFFDVTAWIKWDFMVHKDGPTDIAKVPIDISGINYEVL